MTSVGNLLRKMSVEQTPNEEIFQIDQGLLNKDRYNSFPVFSVDSFKVGCRSNETDLLKSPDLWGINVEGECNITSLQESDGLEFHEKTVFDSQCSLSPWDAPVELDNLRMDDVFQVEKDDLIQGPTLAELNAKDEYVFDALEFDHWPHSVENQNVLKCNSSNNTFQTKPGKDTQNLSLIKYDTRPVTLSVDSVMPSHQRNVCFSSKSAESARIYSKVGSISFPKTDVLKFDSSCMSKNFESSTQNVSLSTSKKQIPSKTKIEECNLNTPVNECADNSEDEINTKSNFLESSEKKESSFEPNGSRRNIHQCKKRKLRRYFWQYNSQSKAENNPLCVSRDDPHVLTNITDPVFNEGCSGTSVRHPGKARRGDGNDLTPNPHKLYNIGLKLKQLSQEIKELTQGASISVGAKPKSRKEKNKLASRACRLKKKAQHEANKLKLYGLQEEHRALMNLMLEVRKMIRQNLDISSQLSFSLTSRVESIILSKVPEPVAGYSAEFVNKVLKTVEEEEVAEDLEQE